MEGILRIYPLNWLNTLITDGAVNVPVVSGDCCAWESNGHLNKDT